MAGRNLWNTRAKTGIIWGQRQLEGLVPSKKSVRDLLSDWVPTFKLLSILLNSSIYIHNHVHPSLKKKVNLFLCWYKWNGELEIAVSHKAWLYAGFNNCTHGKAITWQATFFFLGQFHLSLLSLQSSTYPWASYHGLKVTFTPKRLMYLKI